MSPVPDQDAYVEAMAAHGAHPVRVEMTVVQLTILLSTLQLALRHPAYPESMRAYALAFVEGAIEQLTRLSPVIGQVMAAGSDPALDAEVAP